MNLIVVSRKKLNRLKCGKEKARKLVSTGITQVVELSSPRRTKEEGRTTEAQKEKAQGNAF